MGNYLYNGVSLPPLVGWDGMPPAGIFILNDNRNGTYVLCGVSAAPQCVLVNGEDEPALPFDVVGTVFVASEGAESWGESQNFKPLEYFSATKGAYVRQRDVGWLWTQSDILTADGQNIYMAATAPIKVAEDSGITIEDVRLHYRRGYTAGVVFGRNSGGNLEGNSAADVAKASKNAAIPAAAYSVQPRDNTPGNYLYNGVELPPLPHWDDMPPFGVFIIYIASEQLYRLYGANDAPFCIKTAGAEKIAFSADIFGSYQKARAGETNWFGLKAFDGNLSDIADFEDGIYILRPENKIIWTKETIFNSDGQSVFLAATEPIKIELPEQFTQADLRRSWRRGMALGIVVGVKARRIIAKTQPPSPSWPDDIAPEDEIDNAVDESIKENGGAPIVDKKDKISFNPKGKKYPPVIGYLADDFQITYYDPVTTEFRAIGWQRGELISGGALAWYGMTEYLEAESPGGDYIKDITYCARGALYYNGEKIWPSNYVEPDTPVEPDVPVEPDEPIAADYYLYGTPNESGTIALADGDGYVVYSGDVLSELPEWDKAAYPYLFVYADINVYGANCGAVASDRPATIRLSSGYDVIDWAGTKAIRISETKSVWGQWRESVDYANHVIYSYVQIFSKYDLYKDGKLWQKARDPIPLASNEPATAVYNGVKLPLLPEWDKEAYPYAALEMSFNANDEQVWTGHACQYPIKCQGKYLYAGGSKMFCECWPNSAENNKRAWSEWRNQPFLSIAAEKLKWSNHDINYTEEYGGGLFRSASNDPIPVYEQKE